MEGTELGPRAIPGSEIQGEIGRRQERGLEQARGGLSPGRERPASDSGAVGGWVWSSLQALGPDLRLAGGRPLPVAKASRLPLSEDGVAGIGKELGP